MILHKPVGRPVRVSSPYTTSAEAKWDYTTILNVLTDDSNMVIFLYDSGRRLHYVTPSYEALTGYSASNLMKKHFINYFHPEDSTSMLNALDRVFRGREFHGQFRYITKQKTVKWCSASWKPIRNGRGRQVGVLRKEVDITECKLAETALRDSEDKYRTILETMDEGLYEIDLKGNYTFVNKIACKQLGYGYKELIGLNYRKIMSNKTARYLYAVFHKIYATGKPALIENFEIIRKDGSVRNHLNSVSLLRNLSGQPIGFRIFARDITESKKAEDNLRKSEERYRNILDSMEESYFEADLKGNYIFSNETMVRMLGYTNEEILDMSYHKLVSKEDQHKVFEIFHQVFVSGETIEGFEFEVIDKEGKKIAVESSVILRKDEKGKPVGFSGVVRDITKRREAEEALRRSEEKYRTILETMQEGLFEHDLKGNYTYVNDAGCKLQGYQRDELIRINYRSLFPPETVRFFREVYHRIYETGKPELLMDYEVKFKHGSIRIHQANVELVRDSSGKPIGFRTLAWDVTERRKMEKEKAQLEEQLVHAQKMESAGRLAGGVAHDFNNMLGVILGNAELIKLRLPQHDPLLKDVLEIERAAVRSRGLTGQLLAFSRKQIIAPVVIDLNEQIMNTEKTLCLMLGEDVDLQFYPGRDLWKIKFDPSQIQQILINLATNARDAMPAGGRLTIETANIYLNEAYCKMHLGFLPGHYVLLGVSDDGTGMEKETLQHLFEPFFTTKEIGRGTGLGLATIYGIVKQNNGFINVYSEPGKGTTFKIYIPRSLEDGDVQKIPEEGEEREEELVVFGSRMVLLVEDDDMVRGMTSEMLEAIGHTVLAAGSPAEAESLCENNDLHIDLLLTDVVMPEMSGRELSDRIKSKRPSIKVLFMSGYTSNIIAHHGVLEAGVHFIQKPFSLIELARKVREVILGR